MEPTILTYNYTLLMTLVFSFRKKSYALKHLNTSYNYTKSKIRIVRITIQMIFIKTLNKILPNFFKRHLRLLTCKL